MASECEVLKVTSIAKLKISKFLGKIEIDESYFKAKRVRGKRGAEAANKTSVFGMLKRDGKVYLHNIYRPHYQRLNLPAR